MTGLLSLRSSVLSQKGKIIMFAKSSAATIAGILLLGALTGCSGPNDEATKKMSPSPSATETPSPTPTEDVAEPLESVLDYSQPIVLAKDDLEMEFLTIALASCEKAQQDGFMLSHEEGDSYFRPASTGIFPEWPFDEVFVRDGEAGPAYFRNYPPSMFSPCSLEAAARGKNVDPEYLEHAVQLWASNSYGWSQHNGGANLDEIVFQVTDGLITRFGPYNNMSKVVTYGPLSQEQLALFRD
jgi:hypothetical protein